MPLHRFAMPMLCLLLGGCSLFGRQDPLHVDLAGMQPLPGEGLEMRFNLKLRVQNPNEGAIHFSGVAVEMDLNDLPLASGVSSQGGTVAGFGEKLIEVPVTISAFSVLRQAWGLTATNPVQNVPYALRGKLGGGFWGTRRFTDAGVLSIPEPLDTP